MPRGIENGGVFLDTTRLVVQCLLLVIIVGGAVIALKGRSRLDTNVQPMNKPSIFGFR